MRRSIILGRIVRRGVFTSSSTLDIPIPCSALSPDVAKTWRTVHPCNINIRVSQKSSPPLVGSDSCVKKEYRRHLTFYVCLCQKLYNQYAPEIEDAKCRTAVENYAEKCMDQVVICATTGAYILRKDTGTATGPHLARALAGVYKNSDAERTIQCISKLQHVLLTSVVVL